MSRIICIDINGRTYGETVAKCVGWARNGESRAVLFANVHVIMEAFDDPKFREDVSRADLINPDGVPLVWALRALGEKNATRVYGPDTTRTLLKAAEEAGIPVGFYGGTEIALAGLRDHIRRVHPRVKMVFSMSPPFRALSPAEDDEVVRQISESGVRMLFVGLGCPKQERWVIAHLGYIPAVMLAVGAAFDFLATTKPQAPRWMMRSGMEWIFRLVSEPRRLAYRYFKHNPRFVGLFLHQLLTRHKTST